MTAGTAGRGNLNQRVVVRGVGGMGRFPAIGVAGCTVAAGGKILADRKADQGAAIGVMTAGTGEVGLHTDQSAVVTARTVGAADGHQRRMVGCNCMGGCPTIDMAVGTVAASGEVLTAGKASQAAVGIVTAAATDVGVVGCTGQGVVVTAGATGRCHLDQRTVVRGVRGMGCLPVIGMTATAVAWGRFSCRKADQRAGVGSVAGGTGVMRIGSTTDQRVIVTAATTGTGGGHDHAMVRGDNVGRLPTAGVAACAGATGGEVLTDRQTYQATAGIVTGTAAVMYLVVGPIDERWRIAVTVAATGRGYLNQAVVARRIADMGKFPGVGMAGSTLAATDR